MRWHPLEIDLLSGLEALGQAPAPRYLVGPAGEEGAAALAKLVATEARRFHELEREVAARHVRALEAEAAASAGGGAREHDRAGNELPRALPGHETALERLAEARARLAAHEAALARFADPAATEAATRAALAPFEVRPRAELEALRARPGEGQVVELFSDGYALARDPGRLAARRKTLGLPAGRDWL